MRSKRLLIGCGVGLTIFVAGVKLGTARAAETGAKEVDRVLLAQAMPALRGNTLKTTLVEVVYPPGSGSEPHSHACPVIGYVVAGTIESQVKGGPVAAYSAGQTFYEPPRGVHVVSRNPSKTKAAKLLAYFLCDQEGPLSEDPLDGSGAKK